MYTVHKICTTCGHRFFRLHGRFDHLSVLLFVIGIAGLLRLLWCAFNDSSLWVAAFWFAIPLACAGVHERRMGRLPRPRTAKDRCPACGCAVCAPVDSPLGQQLLERWHTPQQPATELAPSVGGVPTNHPDP